MESRTGFRRYLWALSCVALVSCDHAPVYVPESDQRMQYLAEYYPSIKTIHDQLIFEALNCWRNIRDLKKKRSSFREKETVEIVSAKIKEIEEQKASLELHVKRIHAEAEKGIAYRMFEKIDGGGTRPLALQELEVDCARALARAQDSAAINRPEVDPLAPGFRPPKVIPVWPPRALPVVDSRRNEL
jgi:hypothetical protein